MRECRETIIPLPYGWNPQVIATKIEREVERWWNEGWVFVKAEPDRLLESVCIYFERKLEV